MSDIWRWLALKLKVAMRLRQRITTNMPNITSEPCTRALTRVRPCTHKIARSALPPKADIGSDIPHVAFVPISDIHVLRSTSGSTSRRPRFRCPTRQSQATVLVAKARSLRQAGLSQTIYHSGQKVWPQVWNNRLEGCNSERGIKLPQAGHRVLRLLLST
jgi:hypothetical protein